MTRVLVAGVGNIFLGDDGFGVEVIGRLLREPLPDGVEVLDVGTGSVHLAYQLLDGYDALIMVDALARGAEPGTVCVLRPDVDELEAAAAASPGASPLFDAHSMEPVSVLTMLTALDARPDRTLVVGCEPADVGEGIGLSEPVMRAVDEAVAVVRELVDAEVGERTRGRER